MSILIEFCKWQGFWVLNIQYVKAIAIGWVILCVMDVSVIDMLDKLIVVAQKGRKV